MTAPTIALHADFCDNHDHPGDNHCVAAGSTIADSYNITVNIAAYMNPDTGVGIYDGGRMYTPDNARRKAAALLAEADAADRALDMLNEAGR